MKSSKINYYSIMVAGACILSQSLVWQGLLLLFPQMVLKNTYPAFQIFFSLVYIIGGEIFTLDSDELERKLSETTWFGKSIDLILKGSEAILEFVFKICLIIPEAFTVDNRSGESHSRIREIAERRFFDSSEPIQVRWILFPGAVAVISVLICTFVGEEFVRHYSNVMNFVSGIIGLFFFLRKNIKN